MKVITYSSSVKLPPTIISKEVILQNTQTSLSYTHVHFTNSAEINLNCDILCIDSSQLLDENLKDIKRKYKNTIIWTDEPIKSVLWYLEIFKKNDNHTYVIKHQKDEQNVEIRTDVHDLHVLEDIETKTNEISLEDKGNEYLNKKFKELEKEDKVVQKIFSRLSLMKNNNK